MWWTGHSQDTLSSDGRPRRGVTMGRDPDNNIPRHPTLLGVKKYLSCQLENVSMKWTCGRNFISFFLLFRLGRVLISWWDTMAWTRHINQTFSGYNWNFYLGKKWIVFNPITSWFTGVLVTCRTLQYKMATDTIKGFFGRKKLFS